MKTYFKNALSTLIKLMCYSMLATLIFINESCEKKPCDETPIVDTLEILNPIVYKEALNSYTGNDTLKFKSETGEIYTFLGQGLSKGYYRSFEFMEDRCNTQYTYYNAFEGYNFMAIEYGFDIEYYIKKVKYGSEFHIVVDKFDFSRSGNLKVSTFIDSLQIGSYVYNDVIKINNNNNFLGHENAFIYYNLTEGIIQIVLLNGHTLTKI